MLLFAMASKILFLSILVNLMALRVLAAEILPWDQHSGFVNLIRPHWSTAKHSQRMAVA
jgi:hypothetical protein